MYKSLDEYEDNIRKQIEQGSMDYKKLFNLTNKVAIVTGGAGGLGRNTSLALADFGANVVVTSRNLEKLENVKKEIKQLGKESLAIPCDVTNHKDIKNLVSQTKDRLGRIDILVTYAGLNIPKPAEEYPYEDWKKIIDTNVTGVFLCNQEVGKIMIKQGGGKIINVSSVRAQQSVPRNYVGYCTSKGAVNALTRTLACEWAKYNVLVNAIAPTVIETPLTAHIMADTTLARNLKNRIPLGRWGFPDDLIGAIVYFASDASNFVTGQILYIDGGVTTW
jgi:gluconate 5-dehydrogenase